MDIATKEIHLELSFAKGNILKYVIRFRNKEGKEDLLKALDYARRELLKQLKVDPEKRGKEGVNPINVAKVLSFCAQDCILEEDRDFIFDVANYLHSGLMVKAADTIMAKIKSTYDKKEDEPEAPKSYKQQLKQIKEAADHVLKEVRAREESPKDNLIDLVKAEHESYMDMNLMLQIIRDTITF